LSLWSSVGYGTEECLAVIEIFRVAFGEVSECSVEVSKHGSFPRWDGGADT
jgi:hypothetical protein